MLKLGRITKFKMLFLALVFVFNFDLFKFSAAILEKGLLGELVQYGHCICLKWDESFHPIEGGGTE